MSADNEIMIARFEDGYRVADIQAAENIFYDEYWLYEYFRDAPIIENISDAYEFAWDLYDHAVIVEYGVTRSYWNFTFASLEEKYAKGKAVEIPTLNKTISEKYLEFSW